jgi:hypothetical protein
VGIELLDAFFAFVSDRGDDAAFRADEIITLIAPQVSFVVMRFAVSHIFLFYLDKTAFYALVAVFFPVK